MLLLSCSRPPLLWLHPCRYLLYAEGREDLSRLSLDTLLSRASETGVMQTLFEESC